MYASLGETAELGIEAAWNQAILAIQAFPGRAENRFIRYWLASLKPELIALARSTTQDNLNAEQVANLPFTDLGVDGQRAIADFLDVESARLDSILLRKSRLRELLLERQRAAVMATIFSKPAQWTAIGHLIDLMPGYSFPSDEFTSEGVRLLRGTNIEPGAIRWTDTVHLNVSRAAQYDRFKLLSGDIVIGMDRPLISSGLRLAIVSMTDLPALLVQRVARIRPRAHVEGSYLWHCLASDAFAAHIEPIVTGVSVPHISEEQIAGFRIPLPPPERQQRIARDLRRSAEIVARASSAIERQVLGVEERRRALITAAVTGQIPIPGVAA
jgi:type I restriction enzyme S subunit